VPIDRPSRRLESQRRWRASRLAAAAGVLVVSLACAAGAPAAHGAGATRTQATAKVSVKAIQHALGIHADGIMGPQTRRAIKRFQRAHGLQPDGIAGPLTLAALGLTGGRRAVTLQSAHAADAATILAKIAQCESGGNPAAVSANGRYFGKYQFSRDTWEALGGSGSPAKANEATQDRFAARLYAQRGTAPWPACSAGL
jgi:peptidoglycan hydrolase-like protein with peptidoglycan-binding domain